MAFDNGVLSTRTRFHGLYQYALHLLQEFREFHTPTDELTVNVFVAPGLDNDANEFATSSGFRATTASLIRSRHLWRCGGCSVAAFAAKADLLFSPTALILPLGLVPVVATIADAMPLRLPSGLFSSASLQVQRALSHAAARFSHKILTLSEWSKKDIVELYRVPEDKVSVIYCGYNHNSFNSDPPDADSLERLLSQFGIRRPYIFHHGTIQPRKNFQRLIEAYDLVMSRNRNHDMQLVLAGTFGWNSEPILQSGANIKSSGKVIFTGPLPEDKMALLLKGSEASVIPSLYEGFCLPMVEAMACGVPTIASNASCLPEVSGGVLRYFDPTSVDDMADKIEELIECPELRAELAYAGLRRASFFSWQKCARETFSALLRIHEEITGRSRSALSIS